MEEAYQPNRPDILALRKKTQRHGRRAVVLGTIGLALALPVAAEPFATPFVAFTAVLLIFASGDMGQARYRHGRKRLLLGALTLIAGMLAWIPSSLEGDEVSALLLPGPVALVFLALAALSAAWAQRDTQSAMDLEAKRAQIRAQREVHDRRGKSHEDPGSLTLEEVRRRAAETGGKATIAATPWRGAPDSVSLADERHRGVSPAQRALRKDVDDGAGSLAPPPNKPAKD